MLEFDLCNYMSLYVGAGACGSVSPDCVSAGDRQLLSNTSKSSHFLYLI